MKPRRIGILFYFKSAGDVWVLLGEKRRPIVWVLPVGENPVANKDPWLAATEISKDTLCGMRGAFERRFSVTSPISLFGSN